MAITCYEQMARTPLNANRPLFSRLLTPLGKVLRANETEGKSPQQIRDLAIWVDAKRKTPELIKIPGMNAAISVRAIAIDYYHHYLEALKQPIPAFKPEEAQQFIIIATRFDAEFYCDCLSAGTKRPFRLPTREEFAAAEKLLGLKRPSLGENKDGDPDLRAFYIIEELRR